MVIYPYALLQLVDGYFVHYFAPNDLAPLRKHVVFVLDRSGSMVGVKMKQMKTAMKTILKDLDDGDYVRYDDKIGELSTYVRLYTVEPRSNGPAINGIPPITDTNS